MTSTGRISAGTLLVSVVNYSEREKRKRGMRVVTLRIWLWEGMTVGSLAREVAHLIAGEGLQVACRFADVWHNDVHLITYQPVRGQLTSR